MPGFDPFFGFFDDDEGSAKPKFPLTTRLSASTPAFSLSGSTTTGEDFSTRTSSELKRLGSPAQTQFDLRFPRLLSDIDKLRGTIAPGFSNLRSARLAEVENARTRAVGNLTENLARRRLQGSTFAEAAVTRTELDFAREKANQQAKSFLEEFDANQRIITQEGSVITEGLNREFAELQLASGFSQSVAQIGASTAQFALQIAAEEAAASGELFGTLVGIGASLLLGNPAPAIAGAPSSAFRFDDTSTPVAEVFRPQALR